MDKEYLKSLTKKYNINIISEDRSPFKQVDLYAQGRIFPGRKPTETLLSKHLTREAIDVDTSNSMFGKFKDEAVKAGAIWGGGWKNFVDPPHFQTDSNGVNVLKGMSILADQYGYARDKYGKDKADFLFKQYSSNPDLPVHKRIAYTLLTEQMRNKDQVTPIDNSVSKTSSIFDNRRDAFYTSQNSRRVLVSNPAISIYSLPLPKSEDIQDSTIRMFDTPKENVHQVSTMPKAPQFVGIVNKVNNALAKNPKAKGAWDINVTTAINLATGLDMSNHDRVQAGRQYIKGYKGTPEQNQQLTQILIEAQGQLYNIAGNQLTSLGSSIFN